MKKLIGFIMTFIIVICIFFIVLNKKEDYSKEYTLDDYKIIESYDKDNGYYTFNVNKNDKSYDFVIEHDYSRKRKIVKKVNSSDVNDNTCLNIEVFGEVSYTVCNKDDEYSLLNAASNNNVITNDLYNKYDNVSVYNKNYSYYIWNGYGLTDVMEGKKYNFLSSETYDNSLYYQYDNLIFFADYDQKRTFNKFYVFDMNKKEISYLNFDYDISFDSYFMGDEDGYIYLMDTKNVVQYKINVKKEKVSESSNDDAGYYYNYQEDTLSLKKLQYGIYLFNYNKKYNYVLNDNKLEMYSFNSKLLYKVSNLHVDAIIYQDNETVYYIAEDSLYRFNINDGEEKLVSYFEWNFTYQGKIFIYN